MRKTPFRPNNEISQTYNDGSVAIFFSSNAAPVGRQPKLFLTPKERLAFDERSLGITRIYLGRQNQAEIDRVIRVQRRPISTHDVAITHDGIAYQIDTVQVVPGVYPPSLDLGLRKLTQAYEVMPL